MVKTTEFTKPLNMLLYLTEMFFMIFISKIQAIIYFWMIMSMYSNNGLISLVYPLAVFGYALLEETRPKQFFWTYLRRYTIIIVFLKFIINLKVTETESKSKTLDNVNGWIKLGLYRFDTVTGIMLYMLPEIFQRVIIMFVHFLMALA